MVQKVVDTLAQFGLSTEYAGLIVIAIVVVFVFPPRVKALIWIPIIVSLMVEIFFSAPWGVITFALFFLVLLVFKVWWDRKPSEPQIVVR